MILQYSFTLLQLEKPFINLYLPICHFWLNIPAKDNSETPVALLMYKVYGNVKNPPSLHSELTQVNVRMPCSLADIQTMFALLPSVF